MQQYFVINENGKLKLKDEDLYHLCTVLRAKDKKEIICIDNDKRYLCEFSGNLKEHNIEILHEIINDTELNKDIYLYQALIRNENFDLVLQKATELGCKYIHPTIFKRNVVKIEKNKEESKLNRFQTILKNSSEQSHRSVIPTINPIINVKDITLDEGEIGILCYEREDTKTLFEIKEKIKNATNIKIVIGPEGGITLDEVESLVNKGFKSVSLGKRILRSETAAFNILSIVSYLLEQEK